MAKRETLNWWVLGGVAAVVGMLLLLGVGVFAFTSRGGDEYTSTYVVPETETPEPPTFTIPENPRVLFLGDSLTDGTAATDKAALGFAPRLAALEGWTDYRVDGVGLSGFLSPGISEEAHRTYRDRLQQMYFTKSYAPNVIIFQAGANDVKYPTAAVQSKVIETVEVARKYFPDAEMVLLGPITSSSDLSPVNDAYARGSYAAGIPYIDAKRNPIIPSAERAQLISEDGWHANDAGHARIAEQLRQRLDDFASNEG